MSPAAKPNSMYEEYGYVRIMKKKKQDPENRKLEKERKVYSFKLDKDLVY